MTDSTSSPVYEPGDVVYGADPFKGTEMARPWLILSNHEERPFHGEQYIALTLTTRSWLDGLIEIPDDAWLRGGTPRSSRIVPWGVQSLAQDDIDHWQGHLVTTLTDRARDALIEHL